MRALYRPAMLTQALATDEDRRKMKDPTNVYVWGDGYQVDSSQEFTNFTPKKIRAF